MRLLYNSTLALLFLTFVVGCSTRQEGKRFTGSTEQRLVTYSIEDIAHQFSQEPLKFLNRQQVTLETHFVVKDQVVMYAQERIKTALADEFEIKFVESPYKLEGSRYKLQIFFTSLGTDSDQSGFSFPIINLAEPEKSTSISILAVQMYHGITECRYFIEDLESKEIVQQGKLKSRIRTDRFSTPIFSFPISDLD